MVRLGASIAVLGVLATAWASPWRAAGQDQAHGVVNSVAFDAVPRDVPILVRALDDTDENLAIKREFEAAMTAAGFSMAADGGPLVLSFESREEIAAGPAPDPQTTIRLRDREGRLSTPEQRSVPTIIQTPRQGTQIFHPSRFRIDATIDDLDQGRRLWQGWVHADLGDRNRRSLAEAMVTRMVDTIGRTVREETFSVSDTSGK